MKFKKRLSRERFSLLSAADKKIYVNEWKSIDKSIKTEQQLLEQQNLEQHMMLQNSLDSQKSIEDAVNDIFNVSLSETLDEMYHNEWSDVMSWDEYQKMKPELMEMMKGEQKGMHSLNEAEGQDPGYWIDGLFGKLGFIVAGLGALAALAANLIRAGYQKIMIWKLKRYMNKIVELTDQGVYKQQSWIAKMLPKKLTKFSGERNNSCFRIYQEQAERTLVNSTMNFAQNLGFFAPNDMTNIQSGSEPQKGSGLDAFKENVVGVLQRQN